MGPVLGDELLGLRSRRDDKDKEDGDVANKLRILLSEADHLLAGRQPLGCARTHSLAYEGSSV